MPELMADYIDTVMRVEGVRCSTGNMVVADGYVVGEAGGCLAVRLRLPRGVYTHLVRFASGEVELYSSADEALKAMGEMQNFYKIN